MAPSSTPFFSGRKLTMEEALELKDLIDQHTWEGLTVDGLNTWLTIFLNHLNAGAGTGGRPGRPAPAAPSAPSGSLTPQQRVAVWYVAWSIGIFGNLWGLTSLVRVLPVTVWDLLGPRPGGIFGAPAFLPPAYDGPGSTPWSCPAGKLRRWS